MQASPGTKDHIPVPQRDEVLLLKQQSALSRRTWLLEGLGDDTLIGLTDSRFAPCALLCDQTMHCLTSKMEMDNP